MEMLIPVISIIVPVYNVERYLTRSLGSLIAQSFKNIEIICVDDGSSDGSLRILNQYKMKDARIKVVHQENKGVSSARNLGLSVAVAPYIMFCDPDDEFLPEMCEKMIACIKRSGVDMCRCAVDIIRSRPGLCPQIIDEKFELPFKGERVPVQEEMASVLDGCIWNKIYRKDLIDSYSISFPEGCIHEDSCFNAKYLMVSNSVSFLEDKLYRYVLREEGYMGNSHHDCESALDYVRILQNLHEFVQMHDLWSEKGRLFLRFYVFFFNIAFHAMPKSNHKNAVYDIGLPVLHEIGDANIMKSASGARRKALLSILKRKYAYFGRRYFGVGPFKILKVVSKPSRFEIRVLGVPVWKRRYPGESL
jgi:glycosyltransferase involved in cell wall biosynthesis